MGTRSSIAIENADGTVTGIYVHWDGYLSHNGRILQENYTTEAAVRELIALGDLSSLNKNPNPPVGAEHTFVNSYPDVCVAYGRDRGESNVEAQTLCSRRAFFRAYEQEYNYLFVDGKWLVSTGGEYQEYQTLAEMTADEEND